MRWSRKPAVLGSGHVRTSLAMTIAGAVAATVLLLVILLHAQPDQKRISIYTPQTSYALPVLDRDGKEYVGLLELLEPMGTVSAKADGSKWKLKFGGMEAECKLGQTDCKIHKQEVKLASRFLIESGRGLVPIASLQTILAELLPNTLISVHEQSRRVFVGGTEHKVTYEVKKAGPGKIVFKFSHPVNPFIATEQGRLRMMFSREPIVAASPENKFDDPFINSATYNEANGALEVTVNASQALIASFSDGGRSVTISVSAPQQAAATAKTAPANIAPAGTQVRPETPHPAAAPNEKPRYIVVLDAAHGGEDRGGILSQHLNEKDVTLALARRLHRELAARGISAMMVRDSDVALTSEQRAGIANASGAGLYVALHATGAGHGVHIYTAALAPETAQSEFVPWGSAQAHFVGASSQFANSATTELLKQDMETTDSSIGVAPLNAISGAACAIELSPPNRRRVEDVNDARYQQAVVNAIATAIAASREKLEALR